MTAVDVQPADRRAASTSRSLGPALALVATAAVIIGVVELVFTSREDLVLLRLVTVLAAWVYVAAGVLAWMRRPSNRLGFLITAGGFLLLATNLDVTRDPVLIAISQIVVTLPYSVLVHILLAFPSGRLQSRAARFTVALVYVVSGLLQAPLYLFSEGNPPHRELLIADLPDVAKVAEIVQTGLGTLGVVSTAVILGARLRQAGPTVRRSIAPLHLYGIVGVLYIPFAPNVLTRLGMPNDLMLASQVVDLAGLAAAFTLSLVRGGFSRAGELQELSTWLSTSDAQGTALVEALRRALGDDSVRLLYRSPELQSYVDETGAAAAVADGWRGLAVITSGDRPVGAIEYDAWLIAEPDQVHRIGQMAAVALDRERVDAELRASRREVLRSRARIVEAADAERRRIARDLHDGLQARLVLLGVQAQLLANDESASDTARRSAQALRLGLDAAAAESRGLVHAVLPAALIEAGLGAAVEHLVDQVAIPVDLHVDLAGEPLPTIVESTAYFVLAEALGNALKHARPTALTVRVDRDGATLRAEVVDDGIGGAAVGGGWGLRNMQDRVEAIGGTLTLHSDADGTRLLAELPGAPISPPPTPARCSTPKSPATSSATPTPPGRR